MRDYILNEKEYIKEFIKNEEKEKNLKVKKHINMMAKYYRDNSIVKFKEKDNITKEELVELEKERKLYCKKEIEKVLKNKLESYVADKWVAIIDKNINIAFNTNSKLKEIDKIGITKKEYNTIMEIGNNPGSREKKKCLLTLIVLAKFKNQDNPLQSVIDETKNEIFQLANMKSIKSKKRNECDVLNTNIKSIILGELEDETLNGKYKDGLIEISNIKDKNTQKRKIIFKVNCIDEKQDDFVFFFTKVENIGKKYIEMKAVNEVGTNKKQCEVCGEIIEITNVRGTNKYCKICYDNMVKQSKKDWKIKNSRRD